MTMPTRILFFGRLKEAAGGAEKTVELPPAVRDATSLIVWLSEENQELRLALAAPAVRIAVDQRIVDRDAPISRPREIAFMPPYSGG
jgi:molybdopterin synthase sulfur carrier subunit